MKSEFPEEVLNILNRPIDPAALSQAPRGLTSIKSIYITERLNEAFGIGGWYVRDEMVQFQPPATVVKEIRHEAVEVTTPAFVVVKAHLEFKDFPSFRASAYGGNNNPDLGDAYKGAVSDAISKICAMYLGVAADVYKGLPADRNGSMTQAEVVARGKAKAATLRAQLEASLAVTPENPDGEPPIDAYEDVPPVEEVPRHTPKPLIPKPKPPAGANDVHDDAAISEGKAKRFWALSHSTGKTKVEIQSALAAMGLSSIDNCPWKGKTYESLCEWAGRA